MYPSVDLHNCMCNTIQGETASEDLGVLHGMLFFYQRFLPVTSCLLVTSSSRAVHGVSLVQRPEHGEYGRETEQ